MAAVKYTFNCIICHFKVSLGNEHPPPKTMQNSFAVRLRLTKPNTSLGGQGIVSTANPPTPDNITIVISVIIDSNLEVKDVAPSRDLNPMGQTHIVVHH